MLGTQNAKITTHVAKHHNAVVKETNVMVHNHYALYFVHCIHYGKDWVINSQILIFLFYIVGFVDNI